MSKVYGWCGECVHGGAPESWIGKATRAAHGSLCCLICFELSGNMRLWEPSCSSPSKAKVQPSLSFIHSFIRSFIHSFIHSSIHPSIRLFNQKDRPTDIRLFNQKDRPTDKRMKTLLQTDMQTNRQTHTCRQVCRRNRGLSFKQRNGLTIVEATR